MRNLLLFFSMFVLFNSCASDSSDNNDPDIIISVSEIGITPERIILNIAGSKQLDVSILPVDATNNKVTWESDNESVATVTPSGLVSATGIGTTFITATTEDGGFQANCKISVSSNTLYNASTEDFVNPERGFYQYSDTRSSNYDVLSVNELRGYRESTKSSGASYSVYSSLVFRYFIMKDFTDGPISNDYLASVQKDFDAAREAGVKLIPRFVYTTSVSSGVCGEGWICPPYGDAPKYIVLGQIAQLGPILTANVDVIFALQLGFIGVWGENYYTDYYGDASPNGGQNKILDQNWLDRTEILKAMLDATPDELPIQVRYPQIKQRAIYGISAPTTSAALTMGEAFTGSDKSRIGFHNDCIFASADDYGTYGDYGNSSTSAKTDISHLKPYFSDEGKYVVIGGETCSDGYSPQNNCSPAGIAAEDLRYLHYTYLNTDYNNEVNNDWVDGGCMNEIKKNLGYRLQLDSASYPKSVTTGEGLTVSFYIQNVGFASPMKERPVFLILKKEGTNTEIKLQFDTDLRFWLGNVELTQSFDLQSGTSVGKYDLFLYLPDAHASISSRPEYAIRFSNVDMWEETTGYNKLNYQISIN